MNGVDRLVWVRPPAARVRAGQAEVSVSVKIADDMHRTVTPMSDVSVRLRWRFGDSAPDPTDPTDPTDPPRAQNAAHPLTDAAMVGDVIAVIAGVSILDDPLLMMEEEEEEEDGDEGGRAAGGLGQDTGDDDGRPAPRVVCITIAVPPVAMQSVGPALSLVLEASVIAPAGCDPPWKDTVTEATAGWRYNMGIPTLVLPCLADVEVVSSGDTAEKAGSFREIPRPPHASLKVYEDARGCGHGSTETHGTVWDCGLILAAFLSTPAAKALLDRVGDQVGAIGIDVGCGAGVAGLALASALPDLPVILTDIGVGLTLAARNVAANPSLADRVTVKELWWGTEKEAEVTNGKPVAVVVASDVVYDAEATGPLATTLAALCGPDTVCLLGFRNRTSAQNIRSFFDKLAELGFTQVAVPRADLAPAYRADDAHLLLLTRK